jgi:archaemetzincin
VTPGEPRPAAIVLVPVGAVDAGVLRRLAPPLRRCFGVPIEVGPRLAMEPGWRDPLTGRPRSAGVLAALARSARPGAWMLGVAEADLRGEGAGSVFGEADRGTQCAVVALARLREGRGSDPAVFGERLSAEAVHELSHLAGLDHCADPTCVMFQSADIADTDRKGSEPCARCAATGGSAAREG